MSNAEAELLRVEKQLKAEYSATYRELKKQLTEVMSKMKFKADYTPSQRLIEANKFNRLNKMIDEATAALTATNRQAMSTVNQSLRNQYADTFNQTVEQMRESTDDEQVLKVLDTVPFMTKNKGQKIVSRASNPFKVKAMDNIKDKTVVKATMTQQITNAVSTGLAATVLFSGIKDFITKDLNRATRIAVTESGKVQSQAEQDAGDKVQDKGFYVIKIWQSTRDFRTRTLADNDAFDHVEMDGAVVPNDEPFIVPGKNGNEALMSPRAEGGSAANIIRCRCNSRRISVTKEQYDLVVEAYRNGDYFPDYKSAENLELETKAKEAAAKREAEKSPAQLAREKEYRDKAIAKDKAAAEAKARRRK